MFNTLDELIAADPTKVKDRIVFINHALEKDIRGGFYGQVVGGRARVQ